MRYHNAKAISPVINAVITICTGSCRAQLLNDYLKIAPNIPAISCSIAIPPTNMPVTISLKKTMNKIIPSTIITHIFLSLTNMFH